MLPTLAAAAAVVLAANMWSPSKNAARGVQLTCQEKYCPPTYQIHVDSARNTLMRDDRPRVGTLKAAYDLSKHTYYQEAYENPGVRLVAHTVS